VSELVKRAKELGMTSLAITDHANIFGIKEFAKECMLNDIKPIFGCEVYVSCDEDNSRLYHLTLLAENTQGFNNLIKLVDASNNNIVNVKPAVSKQILYCHTKGLIALSGCIGGEIPKKAVEKSYDDSLSAAKEYQSLFDDNCFYIEITSHAKIHNERYNPILLQISKDTGIPVAATNDVHMVYVDDYKKHPALRGKNVSREGRKLYMMSELELKEQMADFPMTNQAIANAQMIADRCNVSYELVNCTSLSSAIPDESLNYVNKLTQYSAREGYGNNWVWRWKELKSLQKQYIYDVVSKQHTVFYKNEELLPDEEEQTKIFQDVKAELDETKGFPELPASELKRVVDKFVKRINKRIKRDIEGEYNDKQNL